MRLGGSQELLLAAPPFESMGSLPPVVLNATLTPAADGAPGDPPTLTMLLRSAPFTGTIQCFACPGVLPDQPVLDTKKWLLLGRLDGLSVIGTEISGLYSSRMPLPDPGIKVCVSLVPVSDAGFRGSPILVTAVVTETAAAGQQSGDENTALKAA